MANPIMKYYDINSLSWKPLSAKNGIFYMEDTASTDDYKVTLSGLALEKGLNIDLKVNTANTGAARFSIDNGVVYKDIVKNINTALSTGDILASQIISLEYDGVNWLYKNPSTHSATMVTLDTTNFNNKLDSSINTTQKLADAVDNFSDYVHPSTHPATIITLDTTNFNNKLDSSINTTQKLADAVDNFSDYVHPSTHPATMITLDTTNFNNNLDSSINTTQKLAEAVDDLIIPTSWEPISDITLTQDTSEITVSGLTNYKIIKIFVSQLRNTGVNSDSLGIRANGLTTNSYYFGNSTGTYFALSGMLPSSTDTNGSSGEITIINNGVVPIISRMSYITTSIANGYGVLDLIGATISSLSFAGYDRDINTVKLKSGCKVKIIGIK